jgi:hypothetical protein
MGEYALASTKNGNYHFATSQCEPVCISFFLHLEHFFCILTIM